MPAEIRDLEAAGNLFGTVMACRYKPRYASRTWARAWSSLPVPTGWMAGMAFCVSSLVIGTIVWRF